MARKKKKRRPVYKRGYRRSAIADITAGGVTAITGAILVGAVGKVI